jgi:hypothetical protein
MTSSRKGVFSVSSLKEALCELHRFDTGVLDYADEHIAVF